ncbi:hypothetical protein SAMN02799624_03303 [Paenibacillus sp. UNC496MF]|uniref:hypothetical protein n=1 Tax=Paenibacillus sp. UNC496MF TaxID=1502753 RepID=UPI0008E2D5A1|nr:hypothetical protein [Paenibacillus sp. UNC496MF]SFJ11273.1 hypothetical protein SAMN02799624_03303 [Paenibacillus sp. UNC496MF]
MANEHEASYYDRKPYYVSVQAGSVVEDPTVTGYELAIAANEEELNRLQELLEEYATMDEAQTAANWTNPFWGAATDSDKRMNAGTDGLLVDIYRLLYELGTDETKRHVATMGLFPEGSLQ